MYKTVKLTKKQEKQIAKYREKYWRQAISTKPADRIRAEKAAKEFAEIGNVKIDKVVWVMSPEAGKEVYNVACDSLESFSKDLFWDSLWTPTIGSFCDSISSSIHNSFKDSLRELLIESLSDSLIDSLWNSLSNQLRTLLSDSLEDSVMALPKDSWWLAYYSYAVEILKIKCSTKNQNLLRIYNELAASCSAVWIALDQIIICERPETVKIKDGDLVNLTWRK